MTEEENNEEKEEDFDFDFSIYESDDEEHETSIESLKDLKRPNVTGLRSRFSNGEAELDKLADLGALISKYSISIESRTQDLKVLWKYYALLSEFWENIRNIYGSVINTEIDDLKDGCVKLLDKYKDKKIEKDIYEKLLELRSYIYRLKQLSNLGIETERSQRGVYSKAKRGITQ